VPAVTSSTFAVTHEGHSVRGVASDGERVYAAFAAKASGASSSTIEARSGDRTAWSAKLEGTAGELAVAGNVLAVALAARGDKLRGDPAGVVTALDRTTGRTRWQRPFESTEWVLITQLAAVGDDVLVAGSFGGTLRVGAKVVTSGGGSDGFLARVGANGSLVWLVRMGGAGSDGVQGVAVSGEPKASRIAIAGTFSLGADILGAPLASIDLKSPFGDAFVAEFDGSGAARWTATFGSRGDDAVAGVAIDASGRVIVAANVHDVLSMAGSPLVPRGTGDGLVVWYGNGGELGASVLVGGNDFDGIRSIAAIGNEAIIGGFFSGTLQIADRTFTAGGGDDSFVAALDAAGTVTTAWQVGGSGREEITSLQAMPGGFVAGVAHTGDAAIDDVKLPAAPAGTVASTLMIRGR
jgi:outer membrane protein assembly factor BamB